MNNYLIKQFKFSILFMMMLLSLSLKTIAQNKVFKNDPLTNLQAGFQTPPDSVKPSIYWYWINDNISKEGVERDLEAMAKIGIGRVFIGNIGLSKEEGPSYGNVKLFSIEWWNILKHAIRLGSKYGIDIGMFNSPGWSQSGGPWVKPNESMRYLANYELRLKGPQKYIQKLAAPEKNFQDIALIAFPEPKSDFYKISAFNPKLVSSLAISNINYMVDGKVETEAIFPGKLTSDTISIEIELPESFTARSLLIYPAAKPFKAFCELQTMDSDGQYITVKKFLLDRSNPLSSVGFMPYGPVSVAFPAIRSTKFKLIFTNITGNGGVAELELSGAARIENYVEKQLAKMFQKPLPLWNDYMWQDQPEPDSKALVIDPATVIDITKYLSSDGTLNWDVPPGNWVIMRLGMVPTGVTNAPASQEGLGLEVDKMNKKALENHFNSFIGKVIDQMPAKERTSLKYVVADSYETGSQNWSDDFDKDFKKQYGYDPLPWLPVLNGRIVGSANQSDRFLWDVRRLVADQIAYNYVGGLRELSNKNGLKLWLENYGHWGFPAEFLQYGGQSDELGGEFWAEGNLGSIELRAASSAAHIYGKNKVSAESFTASGMPFQRYPGYLKKRGDWAFTQGVNNTLLHVYISQPHDTLPPGINTWFGTEFNRKNTWFNQAKPFFDYMRRCNFMLQQGQPVADVAYYIGEDVPKMTGIRDPGLPEGYSYDYINAEVIENRLSVKDEKLFLPNGISYQLLVLPPEKTIRPEVLKKISELVASGATILGPRPERSPSLQNYPAADQEIKKLAAQLWQNCDGKTVKMVHYGKGMVLNGMSMEDAFVLLKTIPDFKVVADKPVLFTHRRTSDADIYFISNQSDTILDISSAFRVADKQPEWWDAVDGSIRVFPQFTQNKGSVTVPLKLDAYQSGFIVFRKKEGAPTGTGINFPDEKGITNIKGPWQVTFDTAMRGPVQPLIFNQLEGWSKRPEEAIKYYSGTAVYQTTFTAPKIPKGSTIYLHLGDVKVMAQVTLNGKDVGGVWTAPWQVNITNAVKEGNNQLKIKVVNTWVNRLIGDSKLPSSKRITHADINPYTPDSPLEPSGLMGPVTVKAIHYIE